MRVEPEGDDKYYTDGYVVCDKCGDVIDGVVYGEDMDLCEVCY